MARYFRAMLGTADLMRGAILEPQGGAIAPPTWGTLVFLASFVFTACDERSPSTRFPFDAPSTTTSVSPIRWDLEFEIGSHEGPFGRISDLAISADSVLAVGDEYGCVIHLIDYPSGAMLRQIGGCGEGPGELMHVTALTFLADTLAVYDRARRLLVLFDGEGDFIGQRNISQALGAGGMRTLAALDGRLLVSPVIPGASLRRDLVALENKGGWLWGVPTSRMSLETPDKSLVRIAPSCAFKKAPRAIAVNDWEPEVVLLDIDLDPLAIHRADVEGFEPQTFEGEQEQGAWYPAGAKWLACADTLAFVTYRRADVSRGRDKPVVNHAYMLTITASGATHEMVAEHGDSWPKLSTLSPAAGIGDTVFFFANSWGPHPVVRGYRAVSEVRK